MLSVNEYLKTMGRSIKTGKGFFDIYSGSDLVERIQDNKGCLNQAVLEYKLIQKIPNLMPTNFSNFAPWDARLMMCDKLHPEVAMSDGLRELVTNGVGITELDVVWEAADILSDAVSCLASVRRVVLPQPELAEDFKVGECFAKMIPGTDGLWHGDFYYPLSFIPLNIDVFGLCNQDIMTVYKVPEGKANNPLDFLYELDDEEAGNIPKKKGSRICDKIREQGDIDKHMTLSVLGPIFTMHDVPIAQIRNFLINRGGQIRVSGTTWRMI